MNLPVRTLSLKSAASGSLLQGPPWTGEFAWSFWRIGVVLHPQGGALRRYLMPAHLGLGGIIGGGDQYISWISMEDVIGAIDHILFNTNIIGPVNIAAPEPVKNKDFVRTLARILGRPALIAIPAWFVRMVPAGWAWRSSFPAHAYLTKANIIRIPIPP